MEIEQFRPQRESGASYQGGQTYPRSMGRSPKAYHRVSICMSVCFERGNAAFIFPVGFHLFLYVHRDNRNGRSFDSKLEYLVSSIAGMVGLPAVGRKSRKFTILEPFDVSLLPNVQIFDVEKIMLLSSEASSPELASKPSQGKEMYRSVTL